jgi:hypothetical protein
LKRLKWKKADLQAGAKSSQPKIELAARLRRETTPDDSPNGPAPERGQLEKPEQQAIFGR